MYQNLDKYLNSVYIMGSLTEYTWQSTYIEASPIQI